MAGVSKIKPLFSILCIARYDTERRCMVIILLKVSSIRLGSVEDDTNTGILRPPASQLLPECSPKLTKNRMKKANITYD